MRARGCAMPTEVLIAYATRSGSTGEVAEAVAGELREARLTVEVSRMRDLKSIEDCDAVILGAPLYMGRLPGEVHRFLARNRKALHEARNWFFVLGPVGREAKEFATARAQAEKYLAKYAWLEPEELEVFGGKFDVNKMPFPFSLARHLPAFPAKNMPATDCRDWDEIRGWAAAIAREILPAA